MSRGLGDVYKRQPYVPTPPEVVARMVQLADLREGDLVYDLGCGDGRIVIAAVKTPGVRGVCVEIDGPSYHQDEQVIRDNRRDNLNLATDDTRTFRFGPVEVTERACESAAMVAATLRRQGWQGQPHPCRRPGCKVGRPR